MWWLRPFTPVIALAASRYIEQHAKEHRPHTRKLSIREQEALGRFFAPDLLHRARVATAAPPAPPRIQALASALGLPPLLEPDSTAAITFNNVIVHADPLSLRVLFHELVHVEQYRQLKVKGFARCYVSGFLRTGAYEQIPLERHAYELDEKYAANPARVFSVRDEVRRWIEEKRY
jgi:hypothetical protein